MSTRPSPETSDPCRGENEETRNPSRFSASYWCLTSSITRRTEGFRVKHSRSVKRQPTARKRRMKIARQRIAERQRSVRRRIKHKVEDRDEPMFRARNVQFEFAERTQATLFDRPDIISTTYSMLGVSRSLTRSRSPRPTVASCSDHKQPSVDGKRRGRSRGSRLTTSFRQTSMTTQTGLPSAAASL